MRHSDETMLSRRGEGAAIGSRDLLELATAVALQPGEQCTGPGTWHRLAVGELSEASAMELLNHAETCPACASERDLAALFESSRLQRSKSEFEVARISSRLRASLEGAADEHVEEPSPRGVGQRPSWAWAAAALVVITGGLLLWPGADRLPEITSPGAPGALRGALVEVVFPVGDIEGRPDRFKWSRFAGSDRYELVVEEIDGSIAWRLEVVDASVIPPAEVIARFSPAVTYRWRIRAIGPSGEEIGRSRQVEFRIDLEAGSIAIP